MRKILRLIYVLGVRPKRGSTLYNPYLSILFGLKDAVKGGKANNKRSRKTIKKIEKRLKRK